VQGVQAAEPKRLFLITATAELLACPLPLAGEIGIKRKRHFRFPFALQKDFI
jgi:hypothetical protein